MNSDKYYKGIIVRVLIIVITSLALAFITYRTNYLYTISAFVLVIGAETWLLIHYILKRRDEIKRMLEYIKENNPTIYFSESRDYPFNELGYFLNEIGEIVREVRIDRENQFQYMQYIVRHVSVGLIAFDLKGNVEIINKAAMELLGVGEINSIILLEKVKPELPGILNNMKAEEQKVMNLKSNNRIMQLAIRVTVFKIGEKEIRLVSFQDIKNELDEKEIDSWQKLIRVLTHEIINSVTPVTSLTSTISGFFKRGDDIVSSKDLSDETIREALTGLGYIEDRGKNLIDFVSKFRSLTKLPVPRFEETKVTDLLNEINLLKKEELFAKGINFSSSVVSDGLTVFCDRGLIGHVLLNLVNNAVDAVESNTEAKGKSIEIIGSKGEEQRIQIVIADNGTGIPEELVEDIFIPFFTTKENGSGIGLSLCRQIMKLHGGTITVYPGFGIETRFTLKF